MLSHDRPERRTEAIQEAKADSAAAKLKAMISVNATVLRDGSAQRGSRSRSSFRATSCN